MTALKGLRDVGGQLTRWLLFLQQFHFEVVYKPGKSHGNADCLSRLPLQQDSEETIVAAVQEMVDHDTIKQAQANDPLVAAAMHAVQQGTPLPRQYQNCV